MVIDGVNQVAYRTQGETVGSCELESTENTSVFLPVLVYSSKGKFYSSFFLRRTEKSSEGKGIPLDT